MWAGSTWGWPAAAASRTAAERASSALVVSFRSMGHKYSAESHECQRRVGGDSQALSPKTKARSPGPLIPELRPPRPARYEPREHTKNVGEDQEHHVHGLGERAGFPFVGSGQIEQAVAPRSRPQPGL